MPYYNKYKQKKLLTGVLEDFDNNNIDLDKNIYISKEKQNIFDDKENSDSDDKNKNESIKKTKKNGKKKAINDQNEIKDKILNKKATKIK